jgi:hypothetical protein
MRLRTWKAVIAVNFLLRNFEEQTIKDYIRHQERLDGLASDEIGEF